MYSQLTEPERYTLSILKREGRSLRSIATALQRSPSTISREIQRNACHATDGAYRPSKAQERTRGRRSRSRRVKNTTPPSFTPPSNTCCSASNGAPSRSPTTWPMTPRPASAT